MSSTGYRFRFRDRSGGHLASDERAHVQIIGAISQFERSLIAERVRSGLAKCSCEGQDSGPATQLSVRYRARRPVGGFNVVEIQGRCGSRDVSHRHQLTFERNREYWMNAVVAATVARLISDGRGVKPGVHFLVDAVDPIAFIEELRIAGVTDTQSFSAPVNERRANDC